MTQLPYVAIIELGSQYTLLIERTLRELGIRSVILDPQKADIWFRDHQPKAIILSGGASSVYDVDAPNPPLEILSLSENAERPVPLLGICYGMQWIARHLGGEVLPVAGSREYGEAKIGIADSTGKIFEDTPNGQNVWMSHGDSVTILPKGFRPMAYTEDNTIAAMENGPIWGVQFHPEVIHTPFGSTILKNFMKFAGCEEDWVPSSIVSSIQENVQRELGERRVISGFSGGVDSTTISAILSPVLRERLLAVVIDGGHLREGELSEIKKHALSAKVELKIIDAREDFQKELCDVIDAEEKRKRFKKVYTSIFVKSAQEFDASVILQGTLAPDRIESGATGGALIKSHHNVGLDMGNLLQFHPVDHLFKYEIRALAKEVGLPESVFNRQPFPGPGLFLRVVGVPATPDKLDLVRWADNEVKNILVKHGVYEKISQLVVSYMGVNTVGVKGDARVYGGAIVIRAVETTDFMTAKGVHFSDVIEDEICSVLTKHRDVVRVWFDPTKKPPATTEME